MDILASVNLGILRGEMQQLVDPPKMKPTHIFQASQESARTANGHQKDGSTFLERLQNDLETQLDEQEKWSKLTAKLDTKTKQVAATVIRVTTSAKVFQDELAQRTDHVARLQAQLQEKQDRATAQLDHLQQDQLVQQEIAARALETAERTREHLDEQEDRLERVAQRCAQARKKCQDLEDRVETLEINLRGNQSLASHQRDYLQAEWQVEQDHLDHFRQLVATLEEEHSHCQKDCQNLRGKVGLFQDEHTRRTLRAQSVQQKHQEQQAFFQSQLARFQQEMEAVQKDRDEWAAKTLKLVQDAESTQLESAKLHVKVGLFRQQLQTVETTVQRLQARILAHQDEESERFAYADSNDGRDNDSSSSGSSSSSGRASPTSVLKVPVGPATIKTHASSSVWKPPQQQTVNPKPTSSVATKPMITRKPIVAPSKPLTSNTTNKSVVGPISMPAAVRVNHVTVKLPSSANTFSKDDVIMVKPSSGSTWSASPQKPEDSGLSSKLSELAMKVEQQLVRLASKVEVLVEGSSASNGEGVDAGQLSSLKKQIQQDIMRDTGMMQLMQQMNQQCHMLSTKLEGLATELHQRDQRYYALETKLQESEAQHAKQLEHLRSEMERQLQNQQLVFSEKLNEAVILMQRAAMERSRGSLGNSSHVSLESLYPLESPKRNVQVTFIEPQGEAGPNVFVPTLNGNTGLSMASGIMMNKPLFQGLSAAVGKSKQ